MDSSRRRQPDVLPLLFSPRGAIGRSAFATGTALLAGIAFAANGLILSVADDLGLVGFAFVLIVSWSAGALSRKRLHDLGWSGLTIAVFLGAYIVLILMAPFLPVWLPRAEMLHPFLLVAILFGPAVGWLVWLIITPGRLAHTAQIAAARLAAHGDAQANVHA